MIAGQSSAAGVKDMTNRRNGHERDMRRFYANESTHRLGRVDGVNAIIRMIRIIRGLTQSILNCVHRRGHRFAVRLIHAASGSTFSQCGNFSKCNIGGTAGKAKRKRQRFQRQFSFQFP